MSTRCILHPLWCDVKESLHSLGLIIIDDVNHLQNKKLFLKSHAEKTKQRKIIPTEYKERLKVYNKPFTIATSINTEGNFLIVLASIKVHFPMEVNEAPAVTRPDGIKGRRRKRIMDINTYRTEFFCILLQ